ncbi:MAG: hypothetical protein H7X95_08905 [Deltaproteobacteria bacterium]|nr:hypothetical protein [Deltaproteobacteria bacterium]
MTAMVSYAIFRILVQPGAPENIAPPLAVKPPPAPDSQPAPPPPSETRALHAPYAYAPGDASPSPYIAFPPVVVGPPARAGVRFGLAAGVGYIAPYRCTSCVRFQGGGVGLALDLGGTLRPDVAIVGGVAATLIPFADHTTGSLFEVLVGVQYWLRDRIWIRGGFGFAQLLMAKDTQGDRPEETIWKQDAFGIHGATGWELFPRRTTFAMDVQLRTLVFLSGAVVTAGLTLLFGVSWH